jgi:hypothetical protein
MKLREILIEKRKNPKQNPNVSINQEILNAYNNATTLDSINDKNCFVSFTDIDKLGINPQSRYNTPLGIYSYPASYIIAKVGSEHQMDKLPFAGKSPYANIFQTTGNIVNLKTLPNSELIQYYKKIAEYYSKNSGMSWKESVDVVETFINNVETHAKFPEYIGGRLWYVTMSVAKKLSKTPPIAWNKLFRAIGIDGAYDPGVGIIHTSEPTQTVFFSKNVITNNKRVYNKYSPIDVSQSVNKGISKKNKEMALRNYLKSSEKLSSDDFIQRFRRELYDLNDKNLVKQILMQYPTAYIKFNTQISSDHDIATLAIKLDPNNLKHLPQPLHSVEFVKLAMENKLLTNQDRYMLLSYHVNHTPEIMSYIVKRFPGIINPIILKNYSNSSSEKQKKLPDTDNIEKLINLSTKPIPTKWK